MLMKSRFLFTENKFLFSQLARSAYLMTNTNKPSHNGLFKCQPSSNPNSSPVILNVYDMSWINEYISNLGLGIYHSGVEIYSREYCYGGHQLGGSGIFEMFPKDCANLGANYNYKLSIEVGTTDFTYDDVRVILNTMETDFCGDQYHLLRKNCNHFSQAFVEILCGATLPKWVNRLAAMSSKLPFIERSLPREWLTPIDESPSSLLETDIFGSDRRRNSIAESVVDNRSRGIKSIFRQPGTSSKVVASSLSSVSEESIPKKELEIAPPKSGETWRRLSSNFYNYFQRQESICSRGSAADSPDRSSSCNSSTSSFSKLHQASSTTNVKIHNNNNHTSL